MKQEIYAKIKEYNKIIITRHLRPDLDALGSQFGLREAILSTFPNKQVFVTGDENRFLFLGKMDKIDDKEFMDALVIICDVAVSHLVADKRYQLAKEVIVIDHHTNDSDITELKLIDSNYGSCAQLIGEFLLQNHFFLNESAATAILAGIISDSGRFLFPSTNANTFHLVAQLLQLGAKMQFIYDNLYTETLEMRKMKNYFSNQYTFTEEMVAIMKNDQDVFKKFKVDTQTISRGMVNLMSGIENVNIWANFTYDLETGKILCELRSKKIVIVDIAKKYGGGGHNFACGASVENWDEVDNVINDLNERARSYHEKTNN